MSVLLSKRKRFTLKVAIMVMIIISISTIAGVFLLAVNQEEFNWYIYSMMSVLIVCQLFFIIFLRNKVYQILLNQRIWNRKLKNQNQFLAEHESNLIQTERDSSVATLIACVSHEMNTPLGFIRSSLEFLQESIIDLQRLIVVKNINLGRECQ